MHCFRLHGYFPFNHSINVARKGEGHNKITRIYYLSSENFYEPFLCSQFNIFAGNGFSCLCRSKSGRGDYYCRLLASDKGSLPQYALQTTSKAASKENYWRSFFTIEYYFLNFIQNKSFLLFFLNIGAALNKATTLLLPVCHIHFYFCVKFNK